MKNRTFSTQSAFSRLIFVHRCSKYVAGPMKCWSVFDLDLGSFRWSGGYCLINRWFPVLGFFWVFLETSFSRLLKWRGIKLLIYLGAESGLHAVVSAGPLGASTAKRSRYVWMHLTAKWYECRWRYQNTRRNRKCHHAYSYTTVC